MKRYDCLQTLVSYIKEPDIVVTNLGNVISEWESLNPRKGNFYMWHSLGLATSIGLGIALSLPHRKVWVFEGDGGLLMNLGSVATIAALNPSNLKIIVFDNQAYEAPGGHPTATSNGVNLAGIAREAGIEYSNEVKSIQDFESLVEKNSEQEELSLIVAKTELYSKKVEPVVIDAMENKYQFIRWIEEVEGKNIIPRF